MTTPAAAVVYVYSHKNTLRGPLIPLAAVAAAVTAAPAAVTAATGALGAAAAAVRAPPAAVRAPAAAAAAAVTAAVAAAVDLSQKRVFPSPVSSRFFSIV